MIQEMTYEYFNRLYVVANKQIAFGDLNDGIIVNQTKYGDVVSKLK